MNHDDELGAHLRAVPMPADLLPARGFADEALRRRKVGRARRAVAGAVAVLAVLAGTTAVVSAATDAAPPVEFPAAEIPRPGGGPQVVETFSAERNEHYLLDRETGRYLGVPFDTWPSPDQRHVAVRDGKGRFGFADRAEYLREGAEAVAWPEDFPHMTDSLVTATPWSPDGARFMAALAGRAAGGDDETSDPAVRELAVYDTRTRESASTPIPAQLYVTGAAWAADAASFVVVSREPANEGNTLVSLQFTGGLSGGTVLEPEWVVLHGFSPDGRYLLYGLDSGGWAAVLDTATGETVSKFDNGGDYHGNLLGWSDGSIVRQAIPAGTARTRLERLGPGGEVLGEGFDWPAVTITSVGSSAGLPPEAAPLGF